MVVVDVGKVPLGAAELPSHSDGGIWPTDPPLDRMDRLAVPPQPLNAPFSCALLGRRSWAAAGSGLIRRLHRALVVLGRCPHIMPEAARGANRGVGGTGVGGGVGGKSCL
jgi:hypothetical protein